MNKEEQDQLLKKTIEVYGHWPQIEMLQEEIGEVLQGINKLKRTGECQEGIKHPTSISFNSSTDEHRVYCERFYALCSEFADLQIMLDQMRKIFCEEAIQLAYDRKLERHRDRMILKGLI